MPNHFQLKGQIAVVTGASRGIGAAIARAIYAAGGIPVITYKTNSKKAEEVARDCGDALTLGFDAESPDSAKALVAKVIEKYGRIDLLVNNAGILQQKPFLEITEAEWDTMLDTNLKSAFFLIQAAAPHMMEQKSGSVVNISSVGGQFGGPLAPHYAVSKGALLTLTKSMSRLLAPHKVRVNAIAPGFIETDMMTSMASLTDRQVILDQIPLARIGQPSEVGEAVVYLSSEAGSFITGQVININGGQYLG